MKNQMTRFENQTLSTLLCMKRMEIEERLKTEESEVNRKALQQMLEAIKNYSAANLFLDL